jgi:hypothetical protein
VFDVDQCANCVRRYALFVGLVAGFASSTMAEFVWDGDLRARHGRGDVGEAVGLPPTALLFEQVLNTRSAKSRAISVIAVTEPRGTPIRLLLLKSFGQQTTTQA